MSNERKSITIDSASLLSSGGIGGSKRRTKRTSGSGERKIRPSSIVQPSTLKKTLLERIKQHQRTRERSRERDSENTSLFAAPATSAATTNAPDVKGGDNFSQSMDFLRKLAMKRRELQRTLKKSRSDIIPEAKTPEAKLLNQVSETLTNGEILTNTGLLGLPVVPMAVPQIQEPTIHLGAMPMPMMPEISTTGTANAINIPETPPNITDLAEMYNNTIAAASSTPDMGTKPNENSDTAGLTTTTEPPLHIPQKPEDFLPSIFIKDDPPHGCLKNGSKPTFREWATKMLNKPVDAIKNMLGGGGDSSSTPGTTEAATGAITTATANEGLSEGMNSKLDPSQVAGMRVKIRKTKRKRFRIGKHDDVVGVLLKNKHTQRHIQKEHLSLKQKTIGEIRKYLYDHHLLKIGSNAPPDVLRRMYEDSILTGDVKNTNKDVLLHNFMSGGGGGE